MTIETQILQIRNAYSRIWPFPHAKTEEEKIIKVYEFSEWISSGLLFGLDILLKPGNPESMLKQRKC